MYYFLFYFFYNKVADNSQKALHYFQPRPGSAASECGGLGASCTVCFSADITQVTPAAAPELRLLCSFQRFSFSTVFFSHISHNYLVGKDGQ